MSAPWQDEVDAAIVTMLRTLSPDEAKVLLDYWVEVVPRLQDALTGVLVDAEM